MITWKSFNSETGEQIDFCCPEMQSVYGNLVTWDPGDKKWCVLINRKTKFMDPYTSKMIEKIELDKQDLKPIEWCPFCGKNVYKDLGLVSTDSLIRKIL